MSLLQTALTMKQQKLDQNRAKLQSIADQYASIDILKEQDKEYAESRLQKVVDLTNQYAHLDLSDNTLAQSLQGNLSQVIDDNVKNAILSTKLFRSEQAAWNELHTKSPDKYSDINKAFAMQNAKAWMQDERVGSVYNGGGGVIEFTDVNKQLTDKLPQIAKDMGWEYVVDEAGNAMFRETNTYKTVPRDKVEAALSSMLGQKEIKQLQINAWGKYDGASDEQVKAIYDPIIQSQIDAANKRITNYSAQLDVKTGAEREEYQNLIRQEQQRVGNLQNSKFDNIGKEAAYTTLYMQEFKTPFLDAYSYEPIKIKSEVNKLDVETFNSQIKLRQEERADKKFIFEQEKFALDLEYKYKALEGKAKAGTKTTVDQFGNVVEVPATTTTEAISPEEGYNEEAESDLAYGLRLENEAVKGMKDVLTKHGVSPSLLSDPRLINKLSNSSGQDFITTGGVDGKPVKIDLRDPEIRAAVNSYRANVLNDNPIRTKGYAGLTVIENQVIDALTNSIKSGSTDWSPNDNLINFDFLIEKDPDNPGKFRTRQVDKSKVKNYYAALLYKRAQGSELTESEQQTLQAYTSLSLMADPKLSSEQKEMMNDKIEATLVNVKDGNKLFGGSYATAITEASAPTFRNTMGARPDRFLSELSSGDINRGSGIGEIIENGLRVTETVVGDVYNKLQLNPSRKTLIINDKTPAMQTRLAEQLGVSVKDIQDNNVFLTPKLNDQGRFTGEYTGMYRVLNKKDNSYEEVSIGTISSEQARSIGLNITGDQTTQYNANFGEHAPKVDMGTASTDGLEQTRLTRLNTLSGTNMPFYNTDVFVEYAETQNAGAEVAQMFREAMQGKYEFALEAQDGQYFRKIYHVEEDGSRTLFHDVPTGHTYLSDEQLTNMQLQSQLDNQLAFTAAVEAKIPEIKAKKFVSSPR